MGRNIHALPISVVFRQLPYMEAAGGAERILPVVSVCFQTGRRFSTSRVAVHYLTSFIVNFTFLFYRAGIIQSIIVSSCANMFYLLSYCSNAVEAEHEQ